MKGSFITLLRPILVLVLVLGPVQVTKAQAALESDNQDHTDITCPTGSIAMAGAEGAKRVIDAWTNDFTAKCPAVDITTEGGGYPMGGARVCDNHIVYKGVDLGGMSGTFFRPQATTENGWRFQCKRSKRQAILVRNIT